MTTTPTSIQLFPVVHPIGFEAEHLSYGMFSRSKLPSYEGVPVPKHPTDESLFWIREGSLIKPNDSPIGLTFRRESRGKAGSPKYTLEYQIEIDPALFSRFLIILGHGRTSAGKIEILYSPQA